MYQYVPIMYQCVPTWVFGFKVFRLCTSMYLLRTSMYLHGFLVLSFLSQCIYYVLIWVSFQIEVTKYSKIKSYLHYLLHATNLIPEISHYKKI